MSAAQSEKIVALWCYNCGVLDTGGVALEVTLWVNRYARCEKCNGYTDAVEVKQ